MRTIEPLKIIVILLGIISCNSDDDLTLEPDITTLSELRDETTTILTNGNSKTWRISQAQLVNGSNTIDISDNFNVIDDEFIFSGNSDNRLLEWRSKL